MRFLKLDNANSIKVRYNALMADSDPIGTYETRIKSDGKVEATDTITNK